MEKSLNVGIFVEVLTDKTDLYNDNNREGRNVFFKLLLVSFLDFVAFV